MLRGKLPFEWQQGHIQAKNSRDLYSDGKALQVGFAQAVGSVGGYNFCKILPRTTLLFLNNVLQYQLRKVSKRIVFKTLYQVLSLQVYAYTRAYVVNLLGNLQRSSAFGFFKL